MSNNWRIHYEAGADAIEEFEFQKAEQELRMALTDLESTDIDADGMIKVISELVHVYALQEKHPEARKACERLLQLHEKTSGPRSLQVAFTLHQLADLYQKQYRYTEAEPFLQQALELFQEKVVHLQLNVAECLDDLAMGCLYDSKYTEAESYAQQSITLYETTKGADYPGIIQPLETLISSLRGSERYAEAVKVKARLQSLRGNQTKKR